MTKEEYTYLNGIINETVTEKVVINESFGAMDAVLNGIGLVLAPFTGGMSLAATAALDVVINGIANATMASKDNKWKKMGGEFIGATFKLPWSHKSVPAAKAIANWNPLAYMAGDDLKRISANSLPGAAQQVANQVSKMKGTLGIDIATNSVDEVLTREFLISASYLGVDLSNLETQIAMTYNSFIQKHYKQFYQKLMSENISNIAGFWGLNATHMCQVAKIKPVAPKKFNFPDEHQKEAAIVGGEQAYTSTKEAVAQYQGQMQTGGEEEINLFPSGPNEQEEMLSTIEQLDEQSQILYLQNYFLNIAENAAGSGANVEANAASQANNSEMLEEAAGSLIKLVWKTIQKGLRKKSAKKIAERETEKILKGKAVRAANGQFIKGTKGSIYKGAEYVGKQVGKAGTNKSRMALKAALAPQYDAAGKLLPGRLSESSWKNLYRLSQGLTSKQMNAIAKNGARGSMDLAKKMVTENLNKACKKEAYAKLSNLATNKAAKKVVEKTGAEIAARHVGLKIAIGKILKTAFNIGIVGGGIYAAASLVNKGKGDNAANINGVVDPNAQTGEVPARGEEAQDEIIPQEIQDDSILPQQAIPQQQSTGLAVGARTNNVGAQQQAQPQQQPVQQQQQVQPQQQPVQQQSNVIDRQLQARMNNVQPRQYNSKEQRLWNRAQKKYDNGNLQGAQRLGLKANDKYVQRTQGQVAEEVEKMNNLFERMQKVEKSGTIIL